MLKDEFMFTCIFSVSQGSMATLSRWGGEIHTFTPLQVLLIIKLMKMALKSNHFWQRKNKLSPFYASLSKSTHDDDDKSNRKRWCDKRWLTRFDRGHPALVNSMKAARHCHHQRLVLGCHATLQTELHATMTVIYVSVWLMYLTLTHGSVSRHQQQPVFCQLWHLMSIGHHDVCNYKQLLWTYQLYSCTAHSICMRHIWLMFIIWWQWHHVL